MGVRAGVASDRAQLNPPTLHPCSRKMSMDTIPGGTIGMRFFGNGVEWHELTWFLKVTQALGGLRSVAGRQRARSRRGDRRREGRAVRKLGKVEGDLRCRQERLQLCELIKESVTRALHSSRALSTDTAPRRDSGEASPPAQQRAPRKLGLKKMGTKHGCSQPPPPYHNYIYPVRTPPTTHARHPSPWPTHSGLG